MAAVTGDPRPAELSSLGSVGRRLAEPVRRVSLPELAEIWFHDQITCVLPGFGAFAPHLGLLRKLRGALGDALSAGASAAARKRRPCPWEPPCALDIFYREQLRLSGGLGVPKPFVLQADRRGQDLVLRILIFGFACDWTAAIVERLPEVLERRISWRSIVRGQFVPTVEIAKLSVVSRERVVLTRSHADAILTFLTPLNCEGDEDPIDVPWSVVSRLARRVSALARWQDAGLAIDWEVFSAGIRQLSYDPRGLVPGSSLRVANQSRSEFQVPSLIGELRVAEIPPTVAALLSIGETTHIGKGANIGFGRYRTDAG